MPPPRAIIFDYNGVLSDDEPILYEILSGLFAEQGRVLTAEEYFDRFVGLSDDEIIRACLGGDHPAVEEVIAERITRYRKAVADGSTVLDSVRDAVRFAAERVPVAVVSGSFRPEVEPVLRTAGLDQAVSVLVTAEDVERGKPDPEGYLKALALLDGNLEPEEIVVFEDTEAGIAAAKAAGMRCIALTGTLAPERLVAADELAPALDVEIVRRVLEPY